MRYEGEGRLALTSCLAISIKEATVLLLFLKCTLWLWLKSQICGFGIFAAFWIAVDLLCGKNHHKGEGGSSEWLAIQPQEWRNE